MFFLVLQIVPDFLEVVSGFNRHPSTNRLTQVPKNIYIYREVQCTCVFVSWKKKSRMTILIFTRSATCKNAAPTPKAEWQYLFSQAMLQAKTFVYICISLYKYKYVFIYIGKGKCVTVSWKKTSGWGDWGEGWRGAKASLRDQPERLPCCPTSTPFRLSQ